MKKVQVKIETIDPTGVVIDKAEMFVNHIDHYSRMMLVIGETIWMVTENGKTMRRIIPKED